MKEDKNKKKKLGKELINGELGKVSGGDSIFEPRKNHPETLLAYGGPSFGLFNKCGKPKPGQLSLAKSSDSNTLNFSNKKDK